MWCEQCQSDVATEISADGQQLLCTTCHQPVRKVIAPSLHPETRSAREFLERWAREQQELMAKNANGTDDSASDDTASSETSTSPTSPADIKTPAPIAADSPNASPPESTIKQPAPAGHPEVSAETTSPADASDDADEIPPSKQKKYRIDAQHDAPAGPLPPRREGPRRPHHFEKASTTRSDSAPLEPDALPPAPEPKAAEKSSGHNYRLDEEETLAHGPHFDVNTLAPQKAKYPGRAEAMWGQLLAYAGVGLLTMGTVFVLWGYFGEVERYASTGWLMSTAGQMLLLLGIVTLVGGGMQQTTHEVTQRIEHLGGRIIRIEQSTDRILKGPHFQRARQRAENQTGDEQEAA